MVDTTAAPEYLPMIAEARRVGYQSGARLWFLVGMMAGFGGGIIGALIMMSLGH